jgi:DNA primase
MPPPEDPDSFIKTRGGAEFKKLIGGAAGFYDYYLDRLCADNDIATDRGRFGIVRSMAEALHKTGHGVLMDKYAQKTALRLGVTPDAVRSEFKKTQKTPDAHGSEESAEGEPAMARPSARESWLLKVILVHEDLVDWTAAHLDPVWIEHALVREIVKQRIEAHRKQSWGGLSGFLSQTGSAETQTLLTEVTAEERPVPNPAQQLRDIALWLRNQFISRQMSALLQQMNQPEVTEERRLDLLRQQQQLRLLKNRSIDD